MPTAFTEGILTEDERKAAQQKEAQRKALTPEEIIERITAVKIPPEPTPLPLDKLVNKLANLTEDEAELFVGKYDGKKLEHDITGDTLEDVAAVMTERYTEHQRLILAALLWNSCRPGMTDYTVFSDLIVFKPGLTSSKPRKAG